MTDYTDPPKYHSGTPEYNAYATELRGELRLWATGQHPYEYDEENGCGSCGRANPPIGCAINCGARMDDALEHLPEGEHA